MFTVIVLVYLHLMFIAAIDYKKNNEISRA